MLSLIILSTPQLATVSSLSRNIIRCALKRHLFPTNNIKLRDELIEYDFILRLQFSKIVSEHAIANLQILFNTGLVMNVRFP